MFYDTGRFPFVRELESGWPEIAAEMRSLRADAFTPWPEVYLYKHGWDVLGLIARGRRLEENCTRCPTTTRLLEAIPGLDAFAGFSRLAPGTHIRPHTGPKSAVLRCHLGLEVPSGCSLRVGSEVRSWEEGRCLVFDDTKEHEAWNRGDTPRVVLLVDFDPSVAERDPRP